MKPEQILLEHRWKICGKCNHLFPQVINICPVCEKSEGIKIEKSKGLLIQMHQVYDAPVPCITPKILIEIRDGIIKRKVTLFRLPGIAYRLIAKVAKAIYQSKPSTQTRTFFFRFKNGARTLIDEEAGEAGEAGMQATPITTTVGGVGGVDEVAIDHEQETIQQPVGGKSKRTKHPGGQALKHKIDLTITGYKYTESTRR